MLWRYHSLLALIFSAGAVWGQNSAMQSGPDELVRQALDSNREILAARQRVAEARGLLRQAGVRPAAAITANAASGSPLGTTGEQEYSIGYDRPIETGGKRGWRIAVARQALRVAEADLAERTRQLRFAIATRYIDAAAGQRKLRAIDAILDLTREAYRLVDARVRSGDAAPIERQLLLVEQNRARAEREIASGQSQSAMLELRRAMGVDRAFPLDAVPELVPPPPVEASVEQLKQRALDNRADLRSARASAARFTAESSLAEALSRPDLTLSAQYARRYSQFEDPLRTTASGSPLLLKDRDNIATVGISIPLQSRRRNAGNMEAAVARERAAGFEAEQLALAIPLEVEAAWSRYRAAAQAASILSQGVVDQSAKNLSVIRQAYNLGQLRLLDVLTEQRRFLETQMSQIDAGAELARSRAALEQAVGGELQ